MKEYQRVIREAPGSFFLFGPRGTGKSSWIRLAFPDAYVINLLDEKLFQSYLVDIGLFAQTLRALPQGSTVVVDEVQRLPSLLNEVHRFIEERSFRFILSGSSARKLKQQGTNLLAGRALRRDLFPFLPQELGADFDLDRVLAYGSIPVIWSQNSNPEALEVYVQTYLKQEIQAEAQIRNLPSFARFLNIAALFHGQVLNASSLARDAGVQRTTVASYLDVLEDTLMIFRLPGYKANIRVKERSHPKLYWFDAGVVRAIKNQLHPLSIEEKGALFEGFIAGVLRAYKSYHRLFDDWAYWSAQQHEIDFLIFRGDSCVAIEVKASARFRDDYCSGLEAFSLSKPSARCRRRIVVYLGHQRLKTSTGVEILPLADFLSELESATIFPA